MFVKLKKPESYKDIFLNPDGIHKVYLKDKAGTWYYMLKADGPIGGNYNGDRMDEVAYEAEGIPWEKKRAKGYIQIQEKDCIVIESLDNEAVHDNMLRLMEEYA